MQAGLADTLGVRQILIAKRVNFRDDASDRWTARSLSPGFTVCRVNHEMTGFQGLFLQTLGYNVASDFRMPARISSGFSARSATRILVPGKRSP